MNEKSGSRSKVGKVALIVGGVFILLVFLGAVSRSRKNRSSKAAASPPAVSVTASQMVADYEANEVGADSKYKNKVVSVSGTIEGIGKDVMDTPYVSLETGNAVRKVQCMFAESDQPALSALSKGVEITIIGKCNGLMMNVLLEDCRIVK